MLGHIARHRGFRSNSKSEGGANAADETSKMKKAMEATREGLAKYRSFGDMLANDPKFEDRKRNRDKDYSHTAKRSDLEDEVRAILQRNGGSETRPRLTNLQEHFPRRLSANARCRTAKSSSANVHSSRTNCAPRGAHRRSNCSASLPPRAFTDGGRPRRTTIDARGNRAAAKGFGETKKTITFTSLRETLDLDPNARFAGIPKDKENKLDVAARTGGAAYGTKTLKDVLGDAPWQSLIKTPEKLDRIAEVLSFREDIGHRSARGWTKSDSTLPSCNVCSMRREGRLQGFHQGRAHLRARLPQHHSRTA